jgi:hypothetical protein
MIVRCRVAGGLWASLAAAVSMMALATAPLADSSEAALRDAVKALVEEGQHSRREKALVRTRPDFAQGFPDAVSLQDVAAALAEPVHRDPFIDAYVRWQLTSFDPPLPDMDDREFMKLMNAAPALVPSPRAEPDAVRFFEDAERAGTLRPRELESAREKVAALDQAAAAAEIMNQPALEFRDFIASKLGENGPRPRLWLLERCAALIEAGWPARTVKGDLTRSFTAAGADESITAEHRAFIAAQTRRLMGLERRLVGGVTFLANGSLRVQISTAKVDEEDVVQWIARLEGARPR